MTANGSIVWIRFASIRKGAAKPPKLVRNPRMAKALLLGKHKRRINIFEMLCF